MNEYAFKQNQFVHYNWAGVSGIGQVVGAATLEMAIIGRMYIVDAGKEFSSDLYPFSHIVIPEHALTAI